MTADRDDASPYPPGARILARDEEWLVRNAKLTDHDGNLIHAVGITELVMDETITLFDKLEKVDLLEPENTVLVADETPRFRRSRLFLEAVLRRTPLPRAERGLAMSDRFLIDPMPYQQRPAELALRGLRPRILVADVVGLGKTIEIGLLLAELIRRGRGERILVATPLHVLEQFQHEMWTRFAIPMVRLDSLGIERIKREIPAGRNPFTYFKRAIVSIDTLKNSGLYKHHLENTRWDAVVIDESHNLIGETTQRNTLARLLAAQTDALILASATPHNGDKKSFAELIRLLDPAAIADPKSYEAKDIEHLYIRRTKISPEVRDRTSDMWAERGPSVPIRCAARPAEEAVFAELTEVWLPGPRHLRGPVVDRKQRLFPYILVKAFLSSHRAMWETVTNRLYTEGVVRRYAKSPFAEYGTITGQVRLDTGSFADKLYDRERAALCTLQDLLERIGDDDSGKLEALLHRLRKIGVAPGSDVRVVVFSERIATLKWLAEVVPGAMGLANDNVRVMHGGLSDREQLEIVKQFTLAGSSVRLLLTGDVASEGVNLHRECHHLIHFDLPWSLIRIEQRNGRIDRYGQLHSPDFTALILTSAIDGAIDDTVVAEKLLAREAVVHQTLGSAEAATGEYLPDQEERRLIEQLLRGGAVDAVIDGPLVRDVLADLLSGVEFNTFSDPPQATVPSLFLSSAAFAEEALRELYDSPEDELRMRQEDTLLAFDAPDDLAHRLADLPRSYRASMESGGRLRLRGTFDRALAQRKLDETRKKKTTSWPDVIYLSDVHPMMEWLTDKLLVRLGRQQAPVLIAQVDEPVFLVQGLYCNRLGQTTIVDWMAVSGLPDQPRVEPMDAALTRAGVHPDMPNPSVTPDLERLQSLVSPAIQAARVHIEHHRVAWQTMVDEQLAEARRKVATWEQLALDLDSSGARSGKSVQDTAAEQSDLIDQLETVGAPLLRLLAVLDGAR